MDKIIYGGDTETVAGKPNSMQFYSEDTPCEDMIFCNEHNAMEKFLKWCAKRKPRVNHVVYIHNLAFDLIELLWGHHEALSANGGEFDFSAGGFSVRGIYGTPTTCTLRSRSGVCVQLIDSFSFYRGSLASGALLYCPDLPKLRRPEGIGEKRFGPRDAAFIDYAMRDAQVSFHIGKAIEELHREFDLYQCISIADLAARIFRHRFLTYTIPQPSKAVIYESLDAYHGGKNNITVEPGWYPRVKSIDIASAYPHAMRDMPAFSNTKLYKRYKAGGKVRSVPDYGVYTVGGVVESCAWPCLFDHSFKPLRGAFKDMRIQGFEINEALRSGELSAKSIRGTYYDAESDHQAPALRAFCDDFYARKANEKDKVKRYGYKLILNSISGKFIQTRKRTLKTYVDIDAMRCTSAASLVAGGMFHPFIAAAITAHTRSRIHRLEHQYKAIHTATDGIFTRARLGREIRKDGIPRLGDLTNDANGELLLVRNKCYILYSDDGETPSHAFEGKRISKYALHGFQGGVKQLETLVATGRRKYTVNKPNRLKESIAKGLTPNEFRTREMTLRIGPLRVR